MEVISSETAILYQFVLVYVVCIMNFMPKEHEVIKFRTDVALREKSSDSIFSDKLRFIYLSLPFFDKSEEECETGFEKWIYVLKYMEVLERLPFTAQKKIFDHLAKLPDVRFLSSEEREKYDESIKAADDYYGVLMSYYMNSIDEGVAKGEPTCSGFRYDTSFTTCLPLNKLLRKQMSKSLFIAVPKIRLKPKSVSKLMYLSSTCFIIICFKNPCRKVTTLFPYLQGISGKSYGKSERLRFLCNRTRVYMPR